MINTLILIFLIVFGVLTSFEDIVRCKVRNRWVLFAMAFGVVSSITIFFIQGKNWNGLLGFYLNCLTALIFGYILWFSGMWSAGDAKLFLAYAFILPPAIYRFTIIPSFSAFEILINTFLPLMAFYMCYIPFKAGFGCIKRLLLQAFSPQLVLSLGIFVFGFGWLSTFIFGLVRFRSNMILDVVLLFLMILFFSRYLRLRMLPTSIVICIIRVIAEGPNAFSPVSLYRFGIVLLSFVLLRFFLLSLSYEVFSKDIPIEGVKEGMMPAEDVIKENPKRYGKLRNIQYSVIGALISKDPRRSVFLSTPDGLSNKEAAFVKRIHREGFLKDATIRIYETIPFAPFMFLGALFCAIFGTDIVIFIMSYL
jgi:Flp pilus assembly protein protease CpaA